MSWIGALPACAALPCSGAGAQAATLRVANRIGLFAALAAVKFAVGAYLYLRGVSSHGGFGEVTLMIAAMVAFQAELVRRRACSWMRYDQDMELLPDDWTRVFAIETPLLELVARGTVLYFGILVFMRFMPRRTGGELAMMDLVFLLLVAEAAAHALGGYNAVADAVMMIATLMGWNYLLNFLSFHVPFIERLVSAPPLQVVRDGQLLRRNMRREFLTEEELMNHLRQQGVEEIKDVKAAYVEAEGKITVICHKREGK